MEPDMPWERSDPSAVLGSWFDHYAFVPHKSIESKKIIWSGTKAMRRMVYYNKGISLYQWITEKEYVYRRLQGKE